MFFYLSLNFAIKWPGSEPQSAPGIVFTNCIEYLHLWLQKYNQSDFSIDHLLMSMYRGVSWVVGKGCLLWPVCSLDKTLLAFALLHFVFLGQISCNSRYLLSSTFAFQSPMMKKTSFLVLVLEGLVGLHRTSRLQLLQYQWLGHRLGLLWCWMVCPGNEPKSFFCFWDCNQELHFGLLLTMRAIPFLLRDSCSC